mgnify:FL=1
MKHSDAYKDLLKIYSKSHTENFYYYGRCSWNELIEFWTNNLILSIDWYNGFLSRNLLENYQCVPNFGFIKPYFEYSLMGLPFDFLVEKATDEYIKNNNFEKLNIHPIFYYKNEDFKQYLLFRCINNRSTFNKPQLDHNAFDTFCFQEYCNKNKIIFLN